MVKRIAPAIVFGGDINGLGVLRSLGREGIPVHIVASLYLKTRWSRAKLSLL